MHEVHQNGTLSDLTGNITPVYSLRQLAADVDRQRQAAGEKLPARNQIANEAYARLGSPVFNLTRGLTAPIDVDDEIQKIRDYGIPINPDRARRHWAWRPLPSVSIIPNPAPS